MRKVVLDTLQKGQTVREWIAELDGRQVDGQALTVTADARAEPWLDHVVDGWVDGSPASVVAAIVSGKDPASDSKWRRFTISKVGPWRYEVEAFPTPFNNAIDPLSPGMPPSASRRK